MPETRSIGVYDGHPVDKEPIDQEQVLAFASNGKPLYIARAGAGAALTDPAWQIRKMFYDDATGVTLGYAFANSSNLYQFLPANDASYTYISPSVTSASFGNNYTVTLTTSTTSTADVFRPSDGYYSICIFGTWTGAVSLERYHAPSSHHGKSSTRSRKISRQSAHMLAVQGGSIGLSLPLPPPARSVAY